MKPPSSPVIWAGASDVFLCAVQVSFKLVIVQSFSLPGDGVGLARRPNGAGRRVGHLGIPYIPSFFDRSGNGERGQDGERNGGDDGRELHDV